MSSGLSTSIDEPKPISGFRKEIKIDVLEIVYETGAPGSHYMVDKLFETRCTLEIYIAEYQEGPGGLKVMPGEDLWRYQQMGEIRITRDSLGCSKTHIMLPKPFLIPAEALFVKKRSKTCKGSPKQHFKIDIADQYVVKVWLEAPELESPWPPFELESALERNGRMIRWLQEGTYSSTDIRLLCKGLLFPEGGVHGSFDILFKLGGFRIQSGFTLKLDIQYSLPPQLPIQCLSWSEANQEIKTKVVQQDERSFQKALKIRLLTVPQTKRRLYDTAVKNILEPGTELAAVDDSLEAIWSTARHEKMIRERPDIGVDTKSYMIKWDSYVKPLRLSCKFYVPQVLLRFVEENKAWFAENPRLIKEFSLHATSLRLRGSIDIVCFAKCIDMLRSCLEVSKSVLETDRVGCLEPTKRGLEIYQEEAGRGYLFGEIANTEHAEDQPTVDRYSENREVRSGKSELGEDDSGQNMSDQEEVFEDAINKSSTGNTQSLGPSRIASQDFVDEESVFKVAREDLATPAVDDFFDAEESHLQQPQFLHSYWQSMARRWPRIKLHPVEHFAIAVVIAAISIFQGFPDDNIDRLIALNIDYCPNENIQYLVYMYHSANYILPAIQGVFMTQQKLHRIMWEATREICEDWLTDVYRLKDGSRGTVQEAIEMATDAEAWDELWKLIAKDSS